MLCVRACASPEPKTPTFKMPKRLARTRRIAESKRKDFHKAFKKTAEDEHVFLKDFFNDMKILNEPDDITYFDIDEE